MNAVQWPELAVYLVSLVILGALRLAFRSKNKKAITRALEALKEKAFPGKASLVLRTFKAGAWGYGLLQSSSFAFSETLAGEGFCAGHNIEELRFIQDAEGSSAFEFKAGAQTFIVSGFDDALRFYSELPQDQKIELKLRIGKLRAETNLAATDKEIRDRIQAWLESKNIHGLIKKCVAGKVPGTLIVTEDKLGLCLVEEMAQQVGNTERVTKKTRVIDFLTKKAKSLNVEKSRLPLHARYQLSADDDSLKKSVTLGMIEEDCAILIPVIQQKLKLSFQFSNGQSPRERRSIVSALFFSTLFVGSIVTGLYGVFASLLEPTAMTWMTTVALGSSASGAFLCWLSLKSSEPAELA
ncbi:MAG: hypothetical protein P1V97_21810 [Planctomycetota bacterium]|nr:hypothetical protein [Planctomycetota bacterium]